MMQRDPSAIPNAGATSAASASTSPTEEMEDGAKAAECIGHTDRSPSARATVAAMGGQVQRSLSATSHVMALALDELFTTAGLVRPRYAAYVDRAPSIETSIRRCEEAAEVFMANAVFTSEDLLLSRKAVRKLCLPDASEQETWLISFANVLFSRTIVSPVKLAERMTHIRRRLQT